MEASKAQVLNDYAGHFNAGHMIHVSRSSFQDERVSTAEGTTGWRKSTLLQLHITRQVHTLFWNAKFTPGSELLPFSFHFFLSTRVLVLRAFVCPCSPPVVNATLFPPSFKPFQISFAFVPT